MKKHIKIITLSLLASSVLNAGGFRIPETSTNSVALGGANIAHVSSADAAYDNPANMAFMSDNNHLEADVMYVGLSDTKFSGTVSNVGPYELSSEKQIFIIPSIHYVSPKLGDTDIRLGLSVAVPGGLTREWTEQPAKGIAEEFTLQVVEINPTISYAINDQIAVAAGFRILHSSGIVKSSNPATASRDLVGDSFDYGYNVALSYKPTEALDIALTYRSNVDLTQEGNAKLYVGDALLYDGGASVSVPLPAYVTLALAYTLETKTTIEFVYERNFWSSYDTLDFEYTSSIPVILSPMDDPITKDWVDTNIYRLGLTQVMDGYTLMAGIVYDETPTPEKTLNFESPGSNSTSVSFGARYEINEDLDIGLATLYSMKEDRTVSDTVNDNGIDGEFSNTNVLLVSAGLGYKF